MDGSLASEIVKNAKPAPFTTHGSSLIYQDPSDRIREKVVLSLRQDVHLCPDPVVGAFLSITSQPPLLVVPHDEATERLYVGMAIACRRQGIPSPIGRVAEGYFFDPYASKMDVRTPPRPLKHDFLSQGGSGLDSLDP